MSGPGAQLRLLPAAQPLVERLGAEFFRALPRQPGVYRMFDAADRLIYVGKAGNLRDRLSSYRRTHGQSRKTIRLIHTATRIEWELCATEVEARLRENELIRTLRPRFNRAGTWPKSARFITVEALTRPPDPPPAEPLPSGFRLQVVGEPSGEAYGAFRAGAGFGLAALARLLWLAWHPTDDVTTLPHTLLRSESLRRFDATHAAAADWLPPIRAFLRDADENLLTRLVAAVPEPGTSFGRAYVAAQFEGLEDFHRRGPLRNRRLREHHPDAPTTHVLPAELLDDLLVLAPPESRPPAFRPDP